MKTTVYGLLVSHWVTLHGLFMMIGLAIYVTSSHTLYLRRHPSAAIAWVVASFCCPTLNVLLVPKFDQAALMK